MTTTFEIRFGGHIWRVESSNFNGNPKVSIWPYYAHQDGNIKPGRGGLQLPLEQVDGFIDAIVKAAHQLR